MSFYSSSSSPASSSTSLSTISQPTTASTKSLFFTLPKELRLDIYERFLYSHHHGLIDDETVVSPWVGWKSVRLLEVCKQIYEEASPIVYQKMDIGCNLNEWKEFLQRIGTRNIAKIRHLTITYDCCPGERIPCLGWFNEEKEKDNWADIFKLFKMAQTNSQLKTLVLNIFPCQGSWKQLFVHYPERVRYTSCRVFRDIQFLKHVSCFDSAYEICLRGRFDPLWAIALRKRLGFIAKRHEGGDITLINPERSEYGIDLRGYEQSQRFPDVYDEIVPDPEPQVSDDDSDPPDDSWILTSPYG